MVGVDVGRFVGARVGDEVGLMQHSSTQSGGRMLPSSGHRCLQFESSALSLSSPLVLVESQNFTQPGGLAKILAPGGHSFLHFLGSHGAGVNSSGQNGM